jgi:hypothetical protein
MTWLILCSREIVYLYPLHFVAELSYSIGRSAKEGMTWRGEGVGGH